MELPVTPVLPRQNFRFLAASYFVRKVFDFIELILVELTRIERATS